MVITSKYDSTCPVCGGAVTYGMRVNWERGRKATHLGCVEGGQPVRSTTPSQGVVAAASVPPVSPLINLNGTDGDSLLAAVGTAIAGLNHALTDLQMAAPHGRDYQTAPVGTWEAARAQHDSRVARIKAVADELCAIAANVAGQVEERRTARMSAVGHAPGRVVTANDRQAIPVVVEMERVDDVPPPGDEDCPF